MIKQNGKNQGLDTKGFKETDENMVNHTILTELHAERFYTHYGDDAQCSKCGGDIEFVDCENCEDGFSHHDCGEDTCCCLDPEPNVPCDSCNGRGGWWSCVSGCGTTQIEKWINKKEDIMNLAEYDRLMVDLNNDE